jgi:hypothetical protein
MLKHQICKHYAAMYTQERMAWEVQTVRLNSVTYVGT